ncbi:2-oxoisovalerate dehydrogenase E1 component alpha subunit [Oceanospirillum multiglobuliferum]|uniref:2-oxoisovalerate dehydrogenase subunit alpha n=1 Tax=Oceanospirillum multiglobuliferum TaxID=64969 RepID=A0A1T4SMR2_9GAMM|nr:thiamine pyrophosphate-dependent dehydrogenase E1 component subunit alpha [Oceanospirillum multiglobuliferum]OPX54164.1 3-methyl-2-oxobutanoate dehydrogenase [Oceanospirillum multiglobuliferum]SKA29161.1 2-oxoisovalerate dehydrogenase E1 component alpha subunit [Oceanospirillum multiglobuliferum]
MSNSNQPEVRVVHTPTFIDGSDLETPILKILQQDGTLYEGAALPDIDQALALKIYDTFLFIRALDERMVAAQRQGRISFYMTEIGEEAADIGSTAAMASDDLIMAQYREQGALAFRGFPLKQFMHQLFSNENDLGKGRQMPIHYGSRDLNYLTISSPLATQLPQAVGYAYGYKLEQKDNCVICYFGEGAASEGDFHAAINMAGVFKVPVIFFCRNNGYAISTPSSEQFAGDGIAPRAVAYGVKAIRVDGNDVLAVLKATQEARRMAVENNQPVLIEAMTYRLGAHSTSDDPSGYRSKKEEEKWREKDPVQRMKLWLINQGWWSEARDAEELDLKRKNVMAAMKEAEQVPAPSIDELVTDVYDVPPQHLVDQLSELKAHIRKYPDAYPKTAWRLNDE